MISVKYPEPTFKLKRENGVEFIFDGIRKQWLSLNDEEWVRQNFVQYLIQILSYPSTVIAIEKEIRLGELTKRFDILVYDKNHHPWLMVECKGSGVQLSDGTLQQVLRYNISLPVSYLVITNGHYTFAWEKKGIDLKLIQQMPRWK